MLKRIEYLGYRIPGGRHLGRGGAPRGPRDPATGLPDILKGSWGPATTISQNRTNLFGRKVDREVHKVQILPGHLRAPKLQGRIGNWRPYRFEMVFQGFLRSCSDCRIQYYQLNWSRSFFEILITILPHILPIWISTRSICPWGSSPPARLLVQYEVFYMDAGLFSAVCRSLLLHNTRLPWLNPSNRKQVPLQPLVTSSRTDDQANTIRTEHVFMT